MRTILVLLIAQAALAISPQAAQHLQSGREQEKQGHFDIAVTEFRKVTELEPNFPEGFIALGQTYMEQRDFAAAVPPLKRALKLDANLLPAHQLLGYALLAQGYAAEAIPHLERTREVGALGIAKLEAGNLREALANLREALQEQPNDPDLLYYFGRASGLLSKQSIDTLLATHPDSARAHQSMGENYFVLRQLPEAEKEYQKALELRPETPNAHLELGQVYAMGSRWPQAEEQFRAELKLQPGSAEAAFRLGDSLLQQGKVQEARRELRRSDQLMPNMPETLYELGKSSALDGDVVAAEKAWLDVLGIEKDGALAAQAHFGLAGIYRNQGKTAEADKQMQEFREIQGGAASQNER
jgi:tetratricopeptide (TPR) repeat protein